MNTSSSSPTKNSTWSEGRIRGLLHANCPFASPKLSQREFQPLSWSTCVACYRTIVRAYTVSRVINTLILLGLQYKFGLLRIKLNKYLRSFTTTAVYWILSFSRMLLCLQECFAYAISESTDFRGLLGFTALILFIRTQIAKRISYCTN